MYICIYSFRKAHAYVRLFTTVMLRLALSVKHLALNLSMMLVYYIIFCWCLCRFAHVVLLMLFCSFVPQAGLFLVRLEDPAWDKVSCFGAGLHFIYECNEDH